ncbi:hypothetical protein [Nonomuraea sp. NPDC049480]|uniref:hypothetical protein n=1 Tax=Nonomuraea sp. NPDC049480 TaxID=3364353 RepID=UPI0037BC478F
MTTMKHVDAYWRAANYLSIGQIYLLGNPLTPRSRPARTPASTERTSPRSAAGPCHDGERL